MTPEQARAVGEAIAHMTALTQSRATPEFHADIFQAMLDDRADTDITTRLAEMYTGMANLCSMLLSKIHTETGITPAEILQDISRRALGAID